MTAPLDALTGLRNTRRAIGDGTLGGRHLLATPAYPPTRKQAETATSSDPAVAGIEPGHIHDHWADGVEEGVHGSSVAAVAHSIMGRDANGTTAVGRGSASTPGLRLDAGLGWYALGAGTRMDLALDGAAAYSWTAVAFLPAAPVGLGSSGSPWGSLHVEGGALADPSIAIEGSDTGLYRYDAGVVGIVDNVRTGRVYGAAGASPTYTFADAGLDTCGIGHTHIDHAVYGQVFGLVAWEIVNFTGSGALRPGSGDPIDLGQDGQRWRDGWFSRDVDIGGTLTTGAKSFRQRHPHDATKDIHYGCVETAARGGMLDRFRVQAAAGRVISVALPDYWEAITQRVDVHASPVGHFGRAYGWVKDGRLHVRADTPGEYAVVLMADRFLPDAPPFEVVRDVAEPDDPEPQDHDHAHCGEECHAHNHLEDS